MDNGEKKVINVTGITLKGTDAQIKQNYPLDEIYKMVATVGPITHEFTGPDNKTVVVKNVTKADYIKEIDTMLSTMQGGESKDRCWDLPVEGFPGSAKHYDC
jgi:hypothetical protein